MRAFPGMNYPGCSISLLNIRSNGAPPKKKPLMRSLILAFSSFALLILCACTRHAAPSPAESATERRETAEPPHVILVSLDGFRWDYVERFRPPHLERFIAGGVRAESMLSSYPSKTFPNHYTIATGMYPDHHGLVDNSYFDRGKNALYGIGKREVVEDGSWYGGTPIWVHAEKSGMKSASFFFVGSEADVQGVRPSYYYRYDGSIPNEERVRQVLRWLELPKPERPRFVALYFSDMDDVGHRYGPNADDKLREKLMPLDDVLGKLFDGIRETGLPVNVVIVSDHGMSPVSVDQLLAVEQIEDERRYRTVNNGALAHIYLHEGVEAEAVYSDLKAGEKHYRVYRTAEVPYFEMPPRNPRWGEFIVIPDPGHYFVNARTMALRRSAGPKEIGEHGFDPEDRNMHGIFYAAGPAFRQGIAISSFKNIHVYPLICRVLGLDVPPHIDGREEVLAPVLQNR